MIQLNLDFNLSVDFITYAICCVKLIDVSDDQVARRPAIPTTERMMDVDERQTRPEVKQQPAVTPQRDEMPAATSSNPSLSNMINTSCLNLDNPSVKQALDNLISSGPNIFKNISESMAQKSSAAKYTDLNINIRR